MKVTGIETLHCDAGWRNYSFVKLTTDEGIVGWSEYDEGFGSPGVTAAIEQLAERVVGQDVSAHERIYAELYCVTRPAAGGVVAEAMGAIENALPTFQIAGYPSPNAVKDPEGSWSPEFCARSAHSASHLEVGLCLLTLNDSRSPASIHRAHGKVIERVHGYSRLE